MKKLMAVLLVLLVTASFAFANGSPQGAQGKSIPSSPPEMPVVSVQGGQLKGFVEQDGTLAFLGVQYAVAPERFAKPQAVPAWKGVKPAQVYGAIAMIPDQTSVGYDEFVWPHRYGVQNEDCLFVNIWTQSLSTSAKKPVMFFIHGGGFTNGSSIEAVAYEGANLSKYGDVVVVTVNHRLNVLGYLDLSAYGDAYKESGNLGMLDLEAALKWIQNNIAQFGGDPGNVTIFGQSGGATKVQALMHMPTAQGLFHKAIGQSSGAFSGRTPQEAQFVAQKTAEKLGLTQATIGQIKTTPYRTLLAAADEAIREARTQFNVSNINWGVVIDNNVVTADYPSWANAIPYMAGSVFSESATNNLNMISRGVEKNSWTSAQIDKYLNEYLGSNASAAKAEFVKLFPEKSPQDLMFYVGTRASTRDALAIKARTATAPVYNYLFAYEAPVNGGVTSFHCVELMYIFHNVAMRELDKATGGTLDSYKMQDIVANAWLNFAKTGNPSQPGLEWKPFDPATKTGCMIFDKNSRFAPLDDTTLAQLISDHKNHTQFSQWVADNK